MFKGECASQLSPQEIQRLLQEVRSSRPVPRFQPIAPLQEERIGLWPAMVRVGPYTLFLSIPFFLLCISNPNRDMFESLAALSALWTINIIIAWAVYGLVRLSKDAKRGREVSKLGPTTPARRFYE